MPVRLLFAILDNAIANGNSQPQSGRGNDGIRHFKSDDSVFERVSWQRNQKDCEPTGDRIPHHRAAAAFGQSGRSSQNRFVVKKACQVIAQLCGRSISIIR